MIEQEESGDVECAYCGKPFDSEHERGVHISKKHVDTESTITKSKTEHDSRKNIIEDKWASNHQGEKT